MFQVSRNLAHRRLEAGRHAPETKTKREVDISLDKQSVTDGLIRVKLTETDYLAKVEEKVREYSRKANIKGFRQGKVPSGVIKKMFGKSILVEEVNHLVSHGISDYIRDQKLRVLGDPLPNHEKANQIDWDTQKDFEFEFQVGMVDDFNYELSAKVKVKSHPIIVSDKVIDDTLTDLRKRFGQVSYPEVSEDDDNLFGTLPVEGEGAEPKNSYIPITKIEKNERAKFIGLKKEDIVEFDISKVTTDNDVRAQILNISAEEAANAKGLYTVKVNSINRIAPAEVNQEFFDKVFGPGSASNEEEFRNKISETIGANYQRETDHLLDHEIQHYYVDHTDINMPEGFLKQWLKNTSQVDDEVLQKEFGTYKDSIKWDLVRNKIADDHKITVEADDVKARAKTLIAEQFGGPGIAEQLGDRFDAIAENYLTGQDGKGQNYIRLYNQLRTEKIMKVIRENITIDEKKVSLEEFQKIAAEHRH